MTDVDPNQVVEMSGVQFLTTALSYHATLLYELPLSNLVAFVISVDIPGMSRNDRHCLGFVLSTSSMQEIESVLDTFGISGYEERGDDEAEEADDGDDEYEPSESGESSSDEFGLR